MKTYRQHQRRGGWRVENQDKNRKGKREERKKPLQSKSQKESAIAVFQSGYDFAIAMHSH